MSNGALKSFPLVVIPISLHGENQSETLAGSCPICDTHPTLVETCCVLGTTEKPSMSKGALR
jgi:hypothetical protein